MKNLKKITFWLLLMLSSTAVVFTSCKEDEDEITETTEVNSNTKINADGKTGTLTDVEGNSYAIVKIGDQWWMAKNLNTTKYNDGTAIPNVTDATAWGALTTGAYCSYDNDASNVTKYGLLYNWYAVNTGKLAPEGWHVATDAEWTTLQTYLIANGYNYDGTTTDNKIGKALAAKTDWHISVYSGEIGNDMSVNNRTGFSALPGGIRNEATFGSSFNYLGSFGYWWSATESRAVNLYYNQKGLDSYSYGKESGFSVRCVKD
ncbi:MAG: fibrobacter succinogenes major paralogous domain-containing protein [Paludibacteraceae bacterium]|nr:fibrobacter succinogenes major paralogous domain-containing protein [Paludibacteraceae bacterium]MBN2787257.1 fibrobacter succinogenes major paralogous domain-containing protein [Paludibacteraceae bacterium]